MVIDYPEDKEDVANIEDAFDEIEPIIETDDAVNDEVEESGDDDDEPEEDDYE